MRRILGIFVTLVMFVSSPAQAGMQLTLVMVTPEQFSQMKSDEKALEKTLFEPPRDDALEMDKAWHGIHYLLTGNPWSARGTLGQAILGGVGFGPDIGYGPARYLNPRQVAEIAEALKALPVDKFKSRYDPKAMMQAEIYPTTWEREGEEGLTWLVSGLEQLTAFYSRAADQKKGVILAIL
jgi:hypothetical protein